MVLVLELLLGLVYNSDYWLDKQRLIEGVSWFHFYVLDYQLCMLTICVYLDIYWLVDIWRGGRWMDMG